MNPSTLVLILFGLLLLVAAWAIVQLILQNGRILTRLEELERRVDLLQDRQRREETNPDLGLPLGTNCTELELPDLDGRMHRLTDFKGQPLVLLFFDPDSVECQALLPELARLTHDLSVERPRPVLISTGARERNRAVLDAYEVTTAVLLQEHSEAAQLYMVTGTPVAYMADADLRTASPRISGGDGVLQLLELSVEDVPHAATMTIPDDPTRTTPYPSPPGEARQPLADGTPAPGFELPLLDGGTVSLEHYRGQSLLLVFVDPVCEPCRELLPRLQERAESSETRPAILLVSRRGRDLNREMVEQHGLTIPVALQDYWEVSDRYGIRAVPAACLIDVEGVLSTSVLVGKSRVEALVSRVPAHQ
jgi:peroxiredoxin